VLVVRVVDDPNVVRPIFRELVREADVQVVLESALVAGLRELDVAQPEAGIKAAVMRVVEARLERRILGRLREAAEIVVVRRGPGARDASVGCGGCAEQAGGSQDL
jgi:hypothetical protein